MTKRDKDQAQKAAIAKKLQKAKPGDILLFNNAKKFNLLITWLTRSHYYHVGIYQGNSHVVESRPRGVISRDLNGPDGDRSFDVISAPQGKGKAALAWAESQIGADYDKSDAVVITLDQLFKLRLAPLLRHKRVKTLSGDEAVPEAEAQQYSCGEFVALAFRNAGVELFPDREPPEIVPAEFEPLLSKR
jgi:hypothetical protein